MVFLLIAAGWLALGGLAAWHGNRYFIRKYGPEIGGRNRGLMVATTLSGGAGAIGYLLFRLGVGRG